MRKMVWQLFPSLRQEFHSQWGYRNNAGPRQTQKMNLEWDHEMSEDLH
jgi:hypothetical protein